MFDRPGTFSGRLARAVVVLLLLGSSCAAADRNEREAGSDPVSEPTPESAATPTTAPIEPQPSAQPTSPPPDQTPQPTASPEPASPFPVVVEHVGGSTTIDQEPTRIVTLTDTAELASLLALGIQPVAAGQRLPLVLPWISERLDPSVEMFTDADINIERIAAFEPDLIIGPEGLFGDDLGRWQGVAPSIETPDIGWREILRIVAEATGTQDQAEVLRLETEATLASFDPELAATAPTLAFVFAADAGGALVFNADSPLSDTLVAAGLPPLEAPQPDAQPGGNAYPEERLGEIAAEAIVVIDPFGSSLATLEENPLWRTLPAVEAGRVTRITLFDAALVVFDSVLTIPLQLELLERLLGELTPS
ncbi:MAG: ABC transporter substrate-binding protein [Actinomycetota bacterium]